MELDYKKLGLFALIIGAAIIFALLIYFFFFRQFYGPSPVITSGLTTSTATSTLPAAGQATTGTGNNNGSGQFPINSNTSADNNATAGQQSQQNTISALTTSTAYFAAPDGDNNLVYYNAKDGKFYKVTSDGKITEYSDKIFHNVQNVVWSNSKQKAILQYPDGTNIIYDFSQNKQINLQKHWSDFTFSPNDQQIAFKSMALDPENRYLAIGDSSGSNLKIIESIGGSENKFQVNWSPNNAMIAQFVDGKGLNRSEIYFVGLNNENFKSMVVEGRGFEGLWTPDGNAMVYSVYSTDDYKPTLWISGASPDNVGSGRNVLGLDTWASKCSFGNPTTLYCAVPKKMPYGAGIEPELLRGTADDIYQIDMQTGAKKLIAQQGSHEISKIYPLSNSKYILFTDAVDGKIYRIEL
ncbi:MAG: hypothetical protein WCV92_04455 [Candidatus Buchananbacteria bacterium]